MKFTQTRTPIARLMAKVDKRPNGCWIWTASGFWDGYGKFHLNGKSVRAHRASYELHRGPIPAGLVLDHLCRTPRCVNPEHLEPVTVRENTLRSPVASPPHLAARTHCNHGHEYTPENTYVRSHGARLCRECNRLRAARKRRESINAGSPRQN